MGIPEPQRTKSLAGPLFQQAGERNNVTHTLIFQVHWSQKWTKPSLYLLFVLTEGTNWPCSFFSEVRLLLTVSVPGTCSCCLSRNLCLFLLVWSNTTALNSAEPGNIHCVLSQIKTVSFLSHVGPVLWSANMLFHVLKHSSKNTVNAQSPKLTALPCSIVFLFQSCQKMSVIPRKGHDPSNTWNMPVLQTDVSVLWRSNWSVLWG